MSRRHYHGAADCTAAGGGQQRQGQRRNRLPRGRGHRHQEVSAGMRAPHRPQEPRAQLIDQGVRNEMRAVRW